MKKKVVATVNEKVQDDSETCYDVWFVDIDSEKKRQEMEVAELKVLRFSLRDTRMDGIRNE